MLTSFNSQGLGVINYAHTSAVSQGDVIVVGSLTLIALSALAANQRGGYSVSGAEHTVPKASGGSTAIAAGTKVYWDVAEAVAKADSESGANKPLGFTIAAAVDGDTTVKITKTIQ